MGGAHMKNLGEKGKARAGKLHQFDVSRQTSGYTHEDCGSEEWHRPNFGIRGINTRREQESSREDVGNGAAANDMLDCSMRTSKAAVRAVMGKYLLETGRCSTYRS